MQHYNGKSLNDHIQKRVAVFRTFFSPAAKIALILICFGIILRSVNIADVAESVRDISLVLLFAAFLCMLADTFIMAIRCVYLFKAKGIRIGYPAMLRIVFVSNFFSLAIPSSIGADALRIMLLKRENFCVTHSTSMVVMDKVLSVLAMLVFSLAGMLVVWSAIPDQRVLFFLIVVIAVTLLGILASLSKIPKFFLRWLSERLQPLQDDQKGKWTKFFKVLEKLLALLSGIHGSFVDFLKQPRTLVAVFTWNAVNQVFRILMVHFLFLALGYSVSLHMQFAFVPVIMLLTLLPITYFGLGIREGAFLFFFTQIGIPPSVCLSVSFLTYLLIVASMIPGVLLFWVRPEKCPNSL